MATSDSRKMEQTVQQIEDRVRQMRTACQELLVSFELQDRVSYQDTINKMSFIASEMASVQAILRKTGVSSHIEDLGQLLKSHVIVPRQLSTVPDPSLQNLTEGRLITCNPEVVSTLLHPRLNVELEEEERKVEGDRGRVTENVIRQIQSFNKNLDTLTNKLQDAMRQTAAAQQKPLIDYEAQRKITERLVRGTMRGLGIKSKQTAQQPVGGDASATSNPPQSQPPMGGHPATK